MSHTARGVPLCAVTALLTDTCSGFQARGLSAQTLQRGPCEGWSCQHEADVTPHNCTRAPTCTHPQLSTHTHNTLAHMGIRPPRQQTIKFLLFYMTGKEE